jgi:hypothetical protein
MTLAYKYDPSALAPPGTLQINTRCCYYELIIATLWPYDDSMYCTVPKYVILTPNGMIFECTSYLLEQSKDVHEFLPPNFSDVFSNAPL